MEGKILYLPLENNILFLKAARGVFFRHIGCSFLRKYHCVESVQIRSNFWSEYRKIRTRNYSVFRHFTQTKQILVINNVFRPIAFFIKDISQDLNPLSTNPTKWSDTFKSRRQQQTNCLSVFEYFVGLAIKGLNMFSELLIFLHTFRGFDFSRSFPGDMQVRAKESYPSRQLHVQS